MPNKKQKPISLNDDKQQQQILHSFLTPKWGSVIFFNKQQEDIYLPQIMSLFVQQLNELLGIQTIDQWLIIRTIENYSIGRKTLLTLSELLLSIPNIVINNEIAQKIQKSMQHLQLCASTEDERDAHYHCQQGRLLADQVFFDPSLLKLLYFPDDQKFAIYVPLFLPVGIPLAWSLFNDFKTILNLIKKYRTPIVT